jgi:hypothetical protein
MNALQYVVKNARTSAVTLVRLWVAALGMLLN